MGLEPVPLTVGEHGAQSGLGGALHLDLDATRVVTFWRHNLNIGRLFSHLLLDFVFDMVGAGSLRGLHLPLLALFLLNLIFISRLILFLHRL